MKAFAVVVILLIVLCASQGDDLGTVKTEAAPKLAIVVNQEKNKEVNASHVSTQTSKKQAEKTSLPSETIKKESQKLMEHPTAVKEESKAETKQSTFNFGEINHQESNFQKQSQAAKSAQTQWQPNQIITQQTQHQAQVEQQKHNEEVEDENSKLQPWIVEEMRNFEQQVEGIVTQSFHFILESQEKYMYRWNPPKNQILRLSVMLFKVMENGDIMIEQDLQENEFLEVQSRDEGRASYNSLGKVYVSKVFKVDFDTDYKYFQFVSKLPQSVFVVVDLEKLHEVVPQNVAKDQHFLMPLSKLKAIEEEVISGEKMREHTYKYQWGFLDNQFAHDSRLLGFTGFQLIVIIGAAITQLYFIKNLLDNRAIV